MYENSIAIQAYFMKSSFCFKEFKGIEKGKMGHFKIYLVTPQ